MSSTQEARLHPAAHLDDTVHQRVRLGLLSVLAEVDEADFVYLRQVLELSDGNLNRHLAVLAEAGFVTSGRARSTGRARTWVRITAEGRRALRHELAELRRIVESHGRSGGAGPGGRP
jgi:DNA-binding MarR family transcriptional regulator